MSRTQRFVSGTGIGYAHQAAILLVGLWLTPFLLARIGQHDLGLWLVVGQVVGYLGLIELGVIAILPREVAFLSGKTGVDANAEIGRLLRPVRRLVRWQSVALAGICAAVWLLRPVDWQPIGGPLLIVFTAFVALYPFRVDLAVLQGVQELAFVAKAQFAGWFVSTLAAVALVFSGAGLYALVVGWLGLLAVPAAAAMWKVRQRWPRAASGSEDLVIAPYFRRSMWVSVNQIAYVLLNASDLLLVSYLLGPAAVVPYACTGKLVTVFANHPQLLMHAAQPALSELRMSESRARLAAVATALTQVMLMMSGAIAVVVLPLNHFFVQWWVGSEMFGGWNLTLALTLMMVLRHWNVATTQTLFCFGYERQISITGLLDGLLTTVGTVWLVSKLGVIGAPLASIVSVLAISLPINLRAVASEMSVTTRSFAAAIVPLFAAIAGIGAVASVVARWQQPQTVVSAVVLIVPIGLLYSAVVLPLAWYGPAGPYLRAMWPSVGGRRPSAGPAALADSGSYS